MLSLSVSPMLLSFFYPYEKSEEGKMESRSDPSPSARIQVWALGVGRCPEAWTLCAGPQSEHLFGGDKLL